MELMSNPKVMLVGSFGKGALEFSYASAFNDIGCKVESFDISEAEMRYCRFGKFGRLFNKFVPVEPWIHKSNREMVLEVIKKKPDILIVIGQNRVLPSALAQIRAMSSILTVFIWPDTLLNLKTNLMVSLPLFNLICTYSQSNLPVFKKLGGQTVSWLPLGADPHMHPVLPQNDTFKCDVAFIGQWRPERELALATLFRDLPDISIKIWGPDWKRRTKNNKIKGAWQKRSLYGQEFAQASISAKLCLNIIDDTNFPAANMRFFEIPCAGGLQVCSPCPEMENIFIQGETVFYYKSLEELPELVRNLLLDEPLRNKVALKANHLVLNEHSYFHRAKQILSLLNLSTFD
jgi:hypothetical protein